MNVRKQIRKTTADERNAAYQLLTTEQKVAKLGDPRDNPATKQRKRLQRQRIAELGQKAA